jgi:hypothetical protein
VLKEGGRPKEIPERLLRLYCEAAVNKGQVVFWVREVRRRRKGLSDEERSGGPPTAGLDAVIAYRLERDQHTTVRRLVASLGISPQTVIAHLHEGPGTRRFCLRWVPRALTGSQKAKRIRCAQEIIEALDTNSRTGFKYLLTGDELGMTCDQSPTRMRAVDGFASMKTFVRPITSRKPWSLSSLASKESPC